MCIISVLIYHGISILFYFFIYFSYWKDLHLNCCTAGPTFIQPIRNWLLKCFANLFYFVTCDLEIKGSHWRHFWKLVSLSLKFLALGTHHSAQHPFSAILFCSLCSERPPKVHSSVWLFDPAPRAVCQSTLLADEVSVQWSLGANLDLHRPDRHSTQSGHCWMGWWKSSMSLSSWGVGGVGFGGEGEGEGAEGTGDSLPDLRCWRGHRRL